MKIIVRVILVLLWLLVATTLAVEYLPTHAAAERPFRAPKLICPTWLRQNCQKYAEVYL